VSLYALLLPTQTDSQRVAIHTTQGPLTQEALRLRIARARTWLAGQGLQAGDVVALQLPKSLIFLELVLACFAQGLTALPLNPQYTRRELKYFLKDSAARLAITTVPLDTSCAEVKCLAAAGVRQRIDACAPQNTPTLNSPNAVAMLMYTSGTTGRPKGAVLRHANIEATIEALYAAWAWSSDDVLLHALPLFHVHGLLVAQFVALRAGATTVWLDRFRPEEVLQAIENYRATIFMGVPTFYVRLLGLDEGIESDLSSIRLFTSGSAPLAAKTHRSFEERFGHRILERFGMTEIGIVLSNPLEGERRPGSVGLPLPKVEARITDPETGDLLPDQAVGEVQIRGPSVFSGYLNRPEATAKNLYEGWMKTGDLGYRTNDGYYHLVGRSNDTVITGGMNVYPSEVAAELCEHADVLDAAVFGLPDEDLGQRVVACLVSRNPNLDIQPWLRGRIAGYKCPKEYRLVSTLPRNAMGKLDRSALGEAWESRPSPRR
jgi:malonyl-CoA/methylmalonyl-CoA synthetase